MMNLQGAIFNWLSIKVVCKARPDDNAAKETYTFFKEMLEENHDITSLEVVVEEETYIVHYIQGEEKATKQFPKEMVDALLVSIQSEPKYNE